MPGPVIARSSLFPDWIKPENASVFDPAYRAPLRALVSMLGLDDPNQVMAFGTPLEQPAEATAGALGMLAEKFPRFAKAIKAFHGSPHDFEKFSTEHIGTGEGAQAYGHGLYFAESEGTARSYRERLAPYTQTVTVGDQPLKQFPKAPVWAKLSPAEMADHAADDLIARSFRVNKGRNYSVQEFADDAATSARLLAHQSTEVERPYWQAVEQRIKEKAPHLNVAVDKGKMYEVGIKADPEHFLDWNQPFTQQSPRVQAGLIEAMKQKGLPLNEHGIPLWLQRNPTGESMHAALSTKGATQADQQAAGAQLLRNAGIPGIRYFDQASRTAGEGTRNYVVFDDKLIDIMKKYGWALPVAGAGAQTIAQPREKH